MFYILSGMVLHVYQSKEDYHQKIKKRAYLIQRIHAGHALYPIYVLFQQLPKPEYDSLQWVIEKEKDKITYYHLHIISVGLYEELLGPIDPKHNDDALYVEAPNAEQIAAAENKVLPTEAEGQASKAHREDVSNGELRKKIAGRPRSPVSEDDSSSESNESVIQSDEMVAESLDGQYCLALYYMANERKVMFAQNVTIIDSRLSNKDLDVKRIKIRDRFPDFHKFVHDKLQSLVGENNPRIKMIRFSYFLLTKKDGGRLRYFLCGHFKVSHANKTKLQFPCGLVPPIVEITNDIITHKHFSELDQFVTGQRHSTLGSRHRLKAIPEEGSVDLGSVDLALTEISSFTAA